MFGIVKSSCTFVIQKRYNNMKEQKTNKDEGLHPYRWRPKKDLFKRVEKAAKKQSLSVNGFINEAVKGRLKNG